MKVASILIALSPLVCVDGARLKGGALSVQASTQVELASTSLDGIEVPTDIEEIMKQLTMLGIGNIPAVGDVLNLFIGLFWNTAKNVNIVEQMEPFVKQWILDQSLTDLKSELSGKMKDARESLTAAANGAYRTDRGMNFKMAYEHTKSARNRITEEKTRELFRGTVSWLVPLAILELTSLRGEWQETYIDGSDARRRIIASMEEYTTVFDKVVDMYNGMTGNSDDNIGIVCKQNTHKPAFKDFYVTGGSCEHQAFNRKVSFSEASTFKEYSMKNTLAMVKNRFQKETINAIVPLYRSVFNISMADPKDSRSKPKPFNGMETLWAGPSNGALLFGVGSNMAVANNAISENMVSAFSNSKTKSGVILGFDYCVYDNRFIHSFKVIFDTGISDEFKVGFKWIDEKKIECKEILSSYGEVVSLTFAGSKHPNRNGYEIYYMGYAGTNQKPGEYIIFGNTDARDTASHLIKNPGGNYRLRHFKVASVDDEPSVFEFGYQWEN